MTTKPDPARAGHPRHGAGSYFRRVPRATTKTVAWTVSARGGARCGRCAVAVCGYVWSVVCGAARVECGK